MKMSKLIVGISWIGWVVIVVLVAKANLIGFSSVTFQWHNLHQPNTTFRWAAQPTIGGIRVTPDAPTAVKVTVPRAFSTGRFTVQSQTGNGRLIISANAPSGQTMHIVSGPAGQTLTLPLTWSETAVANRTFTVNIATEDAPVILRDMRLTIQRL